ncbi:MAG: hypothetical protein M3480_10845 [Verrucomicrobiota bacterium]|nr:hypothetical protein [Chthoniobacterales bacterium]MDQ3415445.1 hypothetical protein [Verrucomicrobiota bacterium]
MAIGVGKAYVIGLAFVAAGFSSFPLLLAVGALHAVVDFNHFIVCAHFSRRQATLITLALIL